MGFVLGSRRHLKHAACDRNLSAGVFAGLLLQSATFSNDKNSRGCLARAACVALGWLWGLQFPVIKRSGPRPMCWWRAAIRRCCSGRFISSWTSGNIRNGVSRSSGWDELHHDLLIKNFSGGTFSKLSARLSAATSKSGLMSTSPKVLVNW